MAIVALGSGSGETLAQSPAAIPLATKRAIDYDGHVRPILAKHCLSCHGGSKPASGMRIDVRSSLLAGGDLGEAAIRPGKGADSVLIHRVRSDDPDVRMPPKGARLSADEVAVLRAWIDQGALMPATKAKPSSDHWSFRRLVRPTPPRNNHPWGRNEIDAFVVSKLQSVGLTPSPDASRQVLLRRLYLDVLGLAPAPDEVEAFTASLAPDAYERAAEHVLASPHYGERWARHWLDVVRFAESNGFETNHERPSAFHYRDWVVRALNEDMPYDRFVFAQLAGDTIDQDAATGFLVGGPYDTVKSPDPVLTVTQRQNELADMVNTTATTFLGITAGCARCHSHKFDPVPQRDYYALQAVFAGVQHGERPVAVPRSPRQREELREVEERRDTLAKEAAALDPGEFKQLTVLIDDDDTDWVEHLFSPRGHGNNPEGSDRGQRNDPGSFDRPPNLSGGRYTWWNNRAEIDMMAYRPRVSGRFRLWLSWGCGSHTHTTKAQYLLDQDGDLATKKDQQVIATVDQQRFADGTGRRGDQPLWSGFHDAGIHRLQPSSAVILRGSADGSTVTADVIVLQQADSQGDPSRRSDETGGETGLYMPRLGPPPSAARNIEHFAAVQARYVRFAVEATNMYEPCLDELEIWTAESPHRNVALASAGAKARSSGDYQGNPKHTLGHIHDGRYGNDFSWISNMPGEGWVEIELPEPLVINRIDWSRDRKGDYVDRVPTRYRIEVATQPGRWKRVADSRLRAPALVDPVQTLAWRRGGLSSTEAARARSIYTEIESLAARRLNLINQRLAYAGNFSPALPTHRLHRGETVRQCGARDYSRPAR